MSRRRAEALDPAARGDAREVMRLVGYRRRFGSWRVDETAARRSADIRAAALARLVGSGRVAANELLALSRLIMETDPDPAFRVRTLEVLGDHLREAGRDAIPELTEGAWGLLTRSVRSEDPDVAVTALAAIAGLASSGWRPTDADELLRSVAEERPAVVVAAIHGLDGPASSPDRRRRRHLLGLLDEPRFVDLSPELARMVADPAEPDRLDCIRALVGIGDDAAVPALMAVLEHHVPGSVPDRCAALAGLRALGADLPVPVLEGVIREGDPRLRDRAFAALEASPHDVVPTLLALATESATDPILRDRALGRLVSSSDDRAFTVLQARARDDPSQVGRAAALALAGHSHTTTDAPRLAVQLAAGDADAVLRDLEAAAAEGPDAELRAARYVDARLEWLCPRGVDDPAALGRAVAVAASVLAHGGPADGPGLSAMVGLARRLAHTPDSEYDDLRAGDQDVYVVHVVDSEEDTRSEGRRLLALLGCPEPPGGAGAA
ncbi:HEAT repeat domain-containing protein [Agromyces sp. ZXT2-6]|uniref:HEAT repeat domain-containing protein n=1 Tax=Agromyces sp. ZXT2-6 TaxID=3461153 RepID=UPI004054D1B2